MHLTVTGGRMHKVSRSLLFASIVALGGLAACGDDVTVAGPNEGSGSVVVSPSPATVAVGGTVNMVADLNGAAAGQSVSWSSSNSAVASVDASSGVVTGVATGSVAITAKAGTYSGSATVNVGSAGTPSTNENATVSIASVTQGGLGQPVLLNNVQGQIDVTLNVDPGQQNVEMVELVVVDSISGEETVVASQAITASASVAAGLEGLALDVAKANVQAAAAIAAAVPQQIVLSFNTASFDPETGAVAFLNGRKLITARLVLGAGSSEDEVASNSVSVLFNNVDGFYVVQTPVNSIEGRNQPNSAIGPNGFVWFQAGNGIAIKSVPVIYSGVRTVASRTIAVSTINPANGAIAGNVVSKTVAGDGIRNDTLDVGAVEMERLRVTVNGAVDTEGNAFTLVGNDGHGVINAQDIEKATPAKAANAMIGTRIDTIRVDNVAPNMGTYTINATAPNNWVNADFEFISSSTWSGVSDGGVGMPGSFPFGATFEYAGCGADDFVAGETATGADIDECATDLTNKAYSGRLAAADKLGNAAKTGSVLFGVDKTAPVIAYLTIDEEATIADIEGDSVFMVGAETYAGVDADNAVFGVRYTDERSGFDTLTVLPQRVRVTRMAKYNNASECALGTATCDFVNVLGEIESGDPTFRRDTVSIFGGDLADSYGLAGTDDGYYTYETFVVDRAGNKSATIKKHVAIDNTAPLITGITVPATMTPGSSSVTFVPTGTDSLEVIEGSLVLAYPASSEMAARMTIRYPRTMFPQYDAPWNTTLATPVGPGAIGTDGLTVPNVFIGRLEMVDASGMPVAADTTMTLKPDSVGANLYDIKMGSSWATTGDSATAFAAGTSTLLMAPLYDTQIAAGTPFFGRSVTTWTIFPAGTVDGKLAIRATGPTVAVNPPFTNIVVTRLNTVTGEWDYVTGTVSNVVTNDQGATRFYTWTFTPAASEAEVASGDTFRVIGIDSEGNGLSTADYLVP